MNKTTIFIICGLLLLILFFYNYNSNEDELDFELIMQNQEVYEAVKEVAPDKLGFMKDVPSEGRTALVINCNEKEFEECFKVLSRFEIKGELEVQVFSPTRSFMKSKEKSRLRP